MKTRPKISWQIKKGVILLPTLPSLFYNLQVVVMHNDIKETNCVCCGIYIF